MPSFVIRTCDALLALTRKLDWLAPLTLRLFFGYFWAETGWAKLHNLEGATERFVEWGIPLPGFSAAFSAGAEFVGGVLLIVGLFTRFTSIALLINMVVALVLVVSKNIADFDEFVEADEVVYILIFFWLAMAGPGRASLDALVARALGINAPR